MTLRELMSMRGFRYRSIFGGRAADIYFDSPERVFLALGYIVSHCRRFEFEIPENDPQTYKSYPIANGRTSGGHTMKQASQYRIYFDTIICQMNYMIGYKTITIAELPEVFLLKRVIILGLLLV